MDLLLGSDVILDICIDTKSSQRECRLAFDRACKVGRVWLYVGAVQYLHHTLTSRLQMDDSKLDPSKASNQANRLLGKLAANLQWLAALSEDGAVFDEQDPGQAQLARAVARLGPDGRLLTANENLLRSCSRAMSPRDFLSLTEENSEIDFLDLKAQQDHLRPSIETRMQRVLHHGQYIMGPEIIELEERLAQCVGVRHCITVASGTDSLLIAMMALGIGAGDEVITVPYTWISPAETIVLLRAKPVFVDVDPDTYNMNPAQLERAITPRTKAIMPVSIYGQCADMDAINAVAKKHELPVIEDAAQSFGATCKGRKSCALSTIGSTSFFPTKPLGCYGDGGALFTEDHDLADRMRQIRVHGQKKKHHHPVIGINGRLDTLQAAVLLAKLDNFEEEVSHRAEIGARYTRLLSSSQLSTLKSKLRLPHIAPENTSVYAQYTVQLDARDRIQIALKEKGIPSVAYYIVPLHLQPALKYLDYQPGDFPITELISTRCLSLPMSAYLQEADQRRIVDVLVAACSS